jgi:hypothetical protein
MTDNERLDRVLYGRRHDDRPLTRQCESCQTNEATKLVASAVAWVPFEVCDSCAPIPAHDRRRLWPSR